MTDANGSMEGNAEKYYIPLSRLLSNGLTTYYHDHRPPNREPP